MGGIGRVFDKKIQIGFLSEKEGNTTRREADIEGGKKD